MKKVVLKVSNNKKKKIMNKSGAEMTIGTIIVIILALVVLVVIIYGFTTGWQSLWQKMTGISGGKVNVQDQITGCKVACSSGSQFEYCKTRKLVFDDKSIQEMNCKTIEGKNLGLSECSSIICPVVNNPLNINDYQYMKYEETKTLAVCPIETENYYANMDLEANSKVTAAAVKELPLTAEAPILNDSQKYDLMMKGLEYGDNKDYKKAIEYMDAILRSEPLNQYAVYNKAVFYKALYDDSHGDISDTYLKNAVEMFDKYLQVMVKNKCQQSTRLDNVRKALYTLDKKNLKSKIDRTFSENPKVGKILKITIDHHGRCNSVDYSVRYTVGNFFFQYTLEAVPKYNSNTNPTVFSFVPKEKSTVSLWVRCNIGNEMFDINMNNDIEVN